MKKNTQKIASFFTQSALILAALGAGFSNAHAQDEETSNQYTPAIADNVIVSVLARAPHIHFVYGQGEASYNTKAWGENWMKDFDPNHVILLDGDEDTIRALIFKAITKGDPTKFYETTVSPIEKIAQQRFAEYDAEVKGILAAKKFDLNQQDRLVIDTDKVHFSFTNVDRFRQIQLNVESQLLAQELAGKSEAEAIKAVAASETETATAKKKTFASINEQVSRFLSAYVETLDPHTDFMLPAEERAFMAAFQDSFGIGAKLEKNSEGECVINEVLTDSAAQKAGLLAQDILVGYYQGKILMPFKGHDLGDVVGHILGKEGTTVSLRIRRSTVDAKTGVASITEKDYSIVRAKISADATRAQIKVYSFADQNIAVISAPEFYTVGPGLSADIATLYQELSKKTKITGVVFDLSTNPGGDLHEAVSMAGLVVKNAPVVQEARLNYSTEPATVKVSSDRSHGTPIIKVPVLVKINTLSASASEIVAAALQDLGAALVVGESESYGKGTIQTMMPAYSPGRDLLGRLMGVEPEHKDYGMLKETIGAFYRITGATTQFDGVKADLPLYPEGVSFYNIRESTQRAPLNLPTIDAVSGYDFSSNQFFSSQLRTQLVDLNQQRISQNKALQALGARAVEMTDYAKEDLILNLKDRQAERSADIEKAKALLNTLTAAHQITGLKVSQLTFHGDGTQYRDITNFADTDAGKVSSSVKDEQIQTAIRLGYEQQAAEMEAILPIFSDIAKLKAADAATTSIKAPN